MAWLSSLGTFGEILRFIILILEVILVFNLMIVVHEWGHFLAARWRGLKIEKFYVWFGKPLWKKTINGVEYGLGSLPFGGFVALPQMAPMGGLEGEVTQEPLPPITPLDKAIVAFAGPLFSFLLACAFAVVVWQFGKPQSEAHTTTIIGHVEEKSPAEKAGIKPGDKIISVDGNAVKRFEGLVDSVRWSIVASEEATIPIEVERPGSGRLSLTMDPKAWPQTKESEKPAWWEWIFKRPQLRSVGLSGEMTPVVAMVQKDGPAEDAGVLKDDQVLAVDGIKLHEPGGLTDYLNANPDKTSITLDIRRAGKMMQISLAPRIPDKTNLRKPERRIGLAWDTDGVLVVTHPTPYEQVSDGVRHMIALVQKILPGKSDLSPAHMSGPIGVGRLYYKLFQHPDGWRMVLWFSVIFNINLAILNMMPFPVLDGGHITMAISEAIRRKPPTGRILEYVQTACALTLFGFIIFVSFKDLGDMLLGPKPDKMWAELTTDSLPPKQEWLPKDKRAPAPPAAAPAAAAPKPL